MLTEKAQLWLSLINYCLKEHGEIAPIKFELDTSGRVEIIWGFIPESGTEPASPPRVQ
jgi:hypothetical protein